MIRSGICLAAFLVAAGVAVNYVPMVCKAYPGVDKASTVPQSAPAMRQGPAGPDQTPPEDDPMAASQPAPDDPPVAASKEFPPEAPSPPAPRQSPLEIPAPVALPRFFPISNASTTPDQTEPVLASAPDLGQDPTAPKQVPAIDPAPGAPKQAPATEATTKQPKQMPKADPPAPAEVELSVNPTTAVPEPPHLISVEMHSPFEETFASLFSSLSHPDHAFISGEAEYILWFLKGPQSTAPIFSPGILGTTGTVATGLGDTDPTKGPSSGGRLTLAYWQYDDNPWAAQNSVRTFGVEARFFFMGNSSAEAATDAPANLYRPFFDLNNHTESGLLVTAPGIANGSVSARGTASIWGAEANVWKNMFYDKPGTTYAIDFMAGFRYLNATSELDINSSSAYNSTIPAGSPYASFAGNRLQVSDSFTAHNQFYGAQVGVGLTSWLTNFVAFESSLRFAIGTTREDVTILGSQVRTLANGTNVTSNGGLLALPSNIGPHSNTAFTQVPEANFKALFPISKQITLSAGFSALYWNRVARAADQIDRNLDVTQIPNFPVAKGTTPIASGSPSVSFPQSQIWLLGITLGVEYRW